MELDSTKAEAHAAQALVDLLDWKWDQAQRGFEKAIRLDPDCGIARMRWGYALAFLWPTGRSFNPFAGSRAP